MINTWLEYTTPEEYFRKPEKEHYLIDLKTGEVIRANRINGYWFAMWKWIPDNEVKAWTYMI